MINYFSFTLLLGLALGHLTFLFKCTDFIAEYAYLLGLGKLFYTKEYSEWKERENMDYDYPAFIREKFLISNIYKYKLWAVRLFGCPWCISTFLCIVFSVFSFSLYFPLIGFSAAAIAGVTFSIEYLLFKKINS